MHLDTFYTKLMGNRLSNFENSDFVNVWFLEKKEMCRWTESLDSLSAHSRTNKQDSVYFVIPISELLDFPW